MADDSLVEELMAEPEHEPVNQVYATPASTGMSPRARIGVIAGIVVVVLGLALLVFLLLSGSGDDSEDQPQAPAPSPTVAAPTILSRIPEGPAVITSSSSSSTLDGARGSSSMTSSSGASSMASSSGSFMMTPGGSVPVEPSMSPSVAATPTQASPSPVQSVDLESAPFAVKSIQARGEEWTVQMQDGVRITADEAFNLAGWVMDRACSNHELVARVVVPLPDGGGKVSVDRSSSGMCR